MSHKIFTSFILLVLHGRCNGDKGSDDISAEEFEQKVLNAAGEQATNCGKVAISGSPLVVNTCVSDSFILNILFLTYCSQHTVLNIPFYAIYIKQGIDFKAETAVSMNAVTKFNKKTANKQG